MGLPLAASHLLKRLVFELEYPLLQLRLENITPVRLRMTVRPTAGEEILMADLEMALLLTDLLQ